MSKDERGAAKDLRFAKKSKKIEHIYVYSSGLIIANFSSLRLRVFAALRESAERSEAVLSID